MPTSLPPPPDSRQATLIRLYPLNPYAWWRVWWLGMAPQRYLEVQRADSSRLRTTSAALASSLTWLPLLIPSIGAALTPTDP